MKRKAHYVREELASLEFIKRALEKANLIELEGVCNILGKISENISFLLIDIVDQYKKLEEAHKKAQAEIEDLKM